LASSSPAFRSVEAFRTGLRDLGYVEGRNVALEYRLAPEGGADRFRSWPPKGERFLSEDDDHPNSSTPAASRAAEDWLRS
jgi:hypothetical protein